MRAMLLDPIYRSDVSVAEHIAKKDHFITNISHTLLEAEVSHIGHLINCLANH